MKESIQIKIGKNLFDGELWIPASAKGLVIFVHGSGSSRFSPRNQAVAKFFNQQGLGTLLIDFLTREEDLLDSETREFRFDIKMLASRLKEFTQWLVKNEKTKSLPLGYFGSSTGAAAALIGAAENGSVVKAVVSRGGRPDLASTHLAKVRAPVLLIVGGADAEVLELNKLAYEKLNCEKELKVVPEATHLFEEEGALEEVAMLSNSWFHAHF